MVALDVELDHAEVLAQEARTLIEESLTRAGCDRAAFWHAVSLIYRRGLPEPANEPEPEPLNIAA